MFKFVFMLVGQRNCIVFSFCVCVWGFFCLFFFSFFFSTFCFFYIYIYILVTCKFTLLLICKFFKQNKNLEIKKKVKCTFSLRTSKSGAQAIVIRFDIGNVTSHTFSKTTLLCFR